MPLGNMRNYVRATADKAIQMKYQYNLKEPWHMIIQAVLDSNMAILVYVSRLSGPAYTRFMKLVDKEIAWSINPVKSNPYSKTEIRTKPQFIWYRAYSADRKPEITQLFFTDEPKAIEHLKSLKSHGYGNLMVQQGYERYGRLAYDRPVRYTGWDNWRFVYGTKDNLWHLVGPSDRDYATGFTTEQMRKLGPEAAKARYLSPGLIKSNPGVIRMTRDEAHKYWVKGEIEINGVLFDFGKMSYGDYFIEPKSRRPKRETDSFSSKTLWGRVDENDKHYLIFE